MSYAIGRIVNAWLNIINLLFFKFNLGNYYNREKNLNMKSPGKSFMNSNNLTRSLNQKYKPNPRFDSNLQKEIASPTKKPEEILFIPCINCNQLIKIDDIGMLFIK